jgi:hypothetical protein
MSLVVRAIGYDDKGRLKPLAIVLIILGVGLCLWKPWVGIWPLVCGLLILAYLGWRWWAESEETRKYDLYMKDNAIKTNVEAERSRDRSQFVVPLVYPEQYPLCRKYKDQHAIDRCELEQRRRYIAHQLERQAERKTANG